MNKNPVSGANVLHGPKSTQERLHYWPLEVVGLKSVSCSQFATKPGGFMLSTVDLLEVAKHRQGDVTDYRLAKLLGLKPSHISNYRSGRTRPENSIAMRLAELCNLDAAQVIAWVNLERATTESDREVWQMLLTRIEASNPASQPH